MNKLLNKILISVIGLFLFSMVITSCVDEPKSGASEEYVEFFIDNELIASKSMIDNQVQLPEDELVNANLPLNYELIGWFTDINFTNEFRYYDVGQARQAFAKIEKQEELEEYQNNDNLLTLQIIINEEKSYDLEVAYGRLLLDILEYIEEPRKQRFAFAGWSLDGIKEITTQTMSLETTTITPLWNEIIIYGDAVDFFSNINYNIHITRNMNEKNIIDLVDILIDETKDASHFIVDANFAPNNNIEITISRRLINVNSFYGDTQEKLSNGFKLPNMYMDMTQSEIIEAIQHALGENYADFQIEVSNYHSKDLEIVIIYNRITGHMMFDDVITSGRIPHSLVSEMVIFADYDELDILNVVNRVLNDHADSTFRPNLRGNNFNIGVFGVGTRAITITLSRIPLIGIIPTGTAMPRLEGLNIGTIYQDMADYEIEEQIGLAMLELNQSNLVASNFEILLDDVNTTNLSIEINRSLRAYQFAGNARDAVLGLFINDLFRDMTDEEIIILVNQSIDNSQVLWFNHNALNLEIITDVNAERVDLVFTHISRSISLTGDAILELNLSNEDFDLNMTMDNIAILSRIIYIIEQSGGNLNHLEEILPEFTLIINVNISFRWALVYIDLNTSNVYEAIITGATQTSSEDIYVLDVRFGTYLSDALNLINLSSLSHLNPNFTYTNIMVEQESVSGVSVNWGAIRTFEVILTIWTVSEYLRDIIALSNPMSIRSNGDINLERVVNFGTTPNEFINQIIIDYELYVDALEEINMYVLDEEGFIRNVNLNGILMQDVTAYLTINFVQRDLIIYVLSNGEELEFELLFRYGDFIYDTLIEFKSNFYYINDGVAITGWRMFIDDGDGDIDNDAEYYYHLEPGLRMPNHNIRAHAVYRELERYNVNIVFDEDIDVEIFFQGEDVNGQFIGNVLTVRIFENSVVINTLRSLSINRLGFEIQDFIFEDGQVINSDFRMPEEDITIYVTWQIISRYIIIELNIPNNAIGTIDPIPPILVEFGGSISEAMGDLYHLNDLISHIFNGWSFIYWARGYFFDGTHMPYFDIIAEAQWVAREFTVYVFGNGGTVNNQNQITVSVPFGVNLLNHLSLLIDFDTAFNKYAYNFSFLADSSFVMISSDKEMPANNIDLYVIWVETEYQIIFYLNGGILPGFNGNESVTIFMTLYRFVNEFLDSIIPEKTGSQFVGWLYFGNDPDGEIIDRETIFSDIHDILILHAYWLDIMDSKLTLTITSTQTVLFNGSNSITFEGIENINTEEDFINLLINFRRAYNSANGTAASDFLETPIGYVPGVSLIDFHTGDNVDIINEGSFNEEIEGHIRLYTIESHYSQDTTNNIELQTNSDGEQVGVIVSPGWNNPTLDDITFPTFVNGVPVTEITGGAYGWRNITGTLVLPRYIEVIGDGAFQGNRLTSIILEDLPNLHTIGSNAFGQSSVATTIILRDLPSLRTIGANAFLQSQQVTEVTIDNIPSLTSVGTQVFGNGRAGQIFNLRNINPEATFANAFISNWFTGIRVNLLGDWSITPTWWVNRTAVFSGHTNFFNEVGTNITNAARPQ